MSLSIPLAGEAVQLRPAGTMWLPKFETLVVADLHLEKGSAYAAAGQLLPPYDTRETLNRLMAEVEASKAQTLVLLGDSLHDMGAVSRVAEDDRQILLDLAHSLDLVWISGNHDPDGGSVFGGRTLETIDLGSLHLCHEPQAGPRDGEVAGHLHPCAKLLGAGGSVRRRCFVTDGKRLIMPAFGAYTGGLNVLDDAFDGMFDPTASAYLTGRKTTRIGLDQLSPDRARLMRSTRVARPMAQRQRT